ncbi:MAG: C10 family peptidase [Desulfamplus sp.]|nr:C10 family peptidase [Desulfamplus sp.]
MPHFYIMLRNIFLYLFLFLLFSPFNQIYAIQIQEKLVKRLVINWVYEKWGVLYEPSNLTTVDVVKTAIVDDGEQKNCYYVLNFSNSGWIIVAADNVSFPIIAYSQSGKYSKTNHPKQFNNWMKNVANQISNAIDLEKKSKIGSYINKRSIKICSKIQSAWEKYNVDFDNFKNSKIRLSRTSTSVLPLLKTQWSQGKYYNTESPKDADGTDGHVLTGCITTAVAQIMKFHNHPQVGRGAHMYDHDIYGTLLAIFGDTTYNWSDMPNSLNYYNTAVATLMYHVGVALNIRYGADGSTGSSQTDIKKALVNFFRYKEGSSDISKEDYSNNDWINILKTELDNARPIYYSGSNSEGGHAFVCDGYQDDYFHFNWGWGGWADGYYYLDTLNKDYSSGQYALIGIEPDTSDINGATLSGKFQDVDGNTINSGNYFNLQVYSGEPCSDHTYAGGYIIDTTISCNYSVSNLPAGKYFLKIKSSQYTNSPEGWWNGKLSESCKLARSVIVSACDFTNIDFILEYSELEDWERVMNWAELKYPDIFPIEKREEIEVPSYKIRYYYNNGRGIYLGYYMINDHLHYFDGNFYDIGSIANLINQAKFEAKLDVIEIYKGDKNGDGHNICEKYLATEVYSLNPKPVKGLKMKRISSEDEKEYEVSSWRQATKQCVFNYCFYDTNKKNVKVVFIAPNGEKSNTIEIKENLDITKALPAKSWPLLVPIN